MKTDPFKNISPLNLPGDIIKVANLANWQILFDEYLTFEGEYIYTPRVMKKFIAKLLAKANA